MGERSFYLAGVDGCKAGWFVAIASVASPAVKLAAKYLDYCIASSFVEVLSKTRQCKLVCIDIPIGLTDSAEPRKCDMAARKILSRGRAGSIFPPPIRPCLAARSYETASRICFEHSGKRLSRQSFFILPKIREVDEAMTPELQQRVREIHPELAFWALNGGKPARHKKKTLAGRNERMKLLSLIFSDVAELVAKARKPKQVAPDDILDALAAAWTACQAVIGKAKTLPDNPEIDSKGLRMEILCPIATIVE